MFLCFLYWLDIIDFHFHFNLYKYLWGMLLSFFGSSHSFIHLVFSGYGACCCDWFSFLTVGFLATCSTLFLTHYSWLILYLVFFHQSFCTRVRVPLVLISIHSFAYKKNYLRISFLSFLFILLHDPWELMFD